MFRYSNVNSCIVHSIFAVISFFFFFNDTATTEIYTLSLHDALPIYIAADEGRRGGVVAAERRRRGHARSEEHTSELQSQSNLVCRLLLEKKKKTNNTQAVTRHPTPRRD